MSDTANEHSSNVGQGGQPQRTAPPARRRRHQRKEASRRKRKGAPGGKPFVRGFDQRRNLKGNAPEVFELKRALARDGLKYIDQLFRRAMAGSDVALKLAVEQILGRAPQSIEVSGPGGGPVATTTRIDLKGCTDDELATLARIAARASAPPAGDPGPGGDQGGAGASGD